MDRKITSFVFYKNTPLKSFSKTIHFESNEDRDNFFDTQAAYQPIRYETDRFNFVRDRGVLNTDIDYNDFRGINYCSFVSDFEPEIRYYCYVTGYKYINDGVTECTLLIDPVMTYTQGKILQNIGKVHVKRQHLPRAEYDRKLSELRNNDDVLRAQSLGYTFEKFMPFDDFYIIIQSAVDLQSDFGTEKSPRIKTATGTTFDGISSPVDLYVIDEAELTNLMIQLQRFPWITQNFLSIVKIPKGFIDKNDLINVTPKSFDFPHLYRPIMNSFSSRQDGLYLDLDFSFAELLEICGIPEDEKHLFRSEYCTIELNSWGSPSLALDAGAIDEKVGLRLETDSCFGYENILAFYPYHYAMHERHVGVKVQDKHKGSYLNRCLMFSNFDKIPILIDQQGLTKAMNSYQRELEDTRHKRSLTRGAVGTAISAITGLATAGATGGFSAIAAGALSTSASTLQSIESLYVSDREYWEGRKAEEARLSLETDVYSPLYQTNALQQASGNYGVTLKIATPSMSEREEIRLYYKLKGFKCDNINTYLSDVQSMTRCNFVQFTGDWLMADVDIEHLKMLQGIFSDGVELWHSDGSYNPIGKSALDNQWRV